MVLVKRVLQRGHSSFIVTLRRYGMHMGFVMRQECVAAVQAKVLRLNSAAVASVTTGKVRNVSMLSDTMHQDTWHKLEHYIIGELS